MVTKISPNIPKLADYYKQSYLAQVANDMIRKKYLPPAFADKLKNDPMIQATSLFNYSREMFSEWQCPHCAISIKAPKEWIKQHIKTHFRPDSKKENELQIARVNAYR